jgi:hypothetical protein
MSGNGFFFFEGNGFFYDSILSNSSISSSIMTNSSIKTTSIDMLNSAGNYQIITNHNYPVNIYDVANKGYVDNLEISIGNYTLTGTQGTIISTTQMGSYTITITPTIIGGPSAVFNVTKNMASVCGHVARTVMTPSSNLTTLKITWPSNSGIILEKTNTSYDGSYKIKII